jgi:hypothetical protein
MSIESTDDLEGKKLYLLISRTSFAYFASFEESKLYSIG